MGSIDGLITDTFCIDILVDTKVIRQIPKSAKNLTDALEFSFIKYLPIKNGKISVNYSHVPIHKLKK